jgi:hypothetical protein
METAMEAVMIESHCAGRHAGREHKRDRACENLFPHLNLLNIYGCTAESTTVPRCCCDGGREQRLK